MTDAEALQVVAAAERCGAKFATREEWITAVAVRRMTAGWRWV